MATTHRTSSRPSTPPLRIQTRPRRLSRFTEGSEVTGPEILQRTPESNFHLFTILSEMDAHEARRRFASSSQSPSSPDNNRHWGSSSMSSVESFGLMDRDQEKALFEQGVKQGRRSVTFGSVGRKSLEERPRDVGGELGEKIREFRGRLRAFTVGKGA